MIQSIRAKLRALLGNVLRALGMPIATSTPAETLQVVSEKLAIKAPVDHVPLASSSAISNRPSICGRWFTASLQDGLERS